eukprot:gene13165-biopygen12862
MEGFFWAGIKRVADMREDQSKSQCRSIAKRERLVLTNGITTMAPQLKRDAEEAEPSKEQAAKKQAVRDEEDEPKWPMGADSLIVACRKGDIKATLSMLRRGADKEARDDVSAKNNDGDTHLDLAVDDGENEIAQLLREHGAMS